MLQILQEAYHYHINGRQKQRDFGFYRSVTKGIEFSGRQNYEQKSKSDIQDC